MNHLMNQLPSGRYVRNPFQILLPLAGLFLLYGLTLWVVAFVVPGFTYPGRAHADALSAVFAPTVLLAILFQTLPRDWCVRGVRPAVMALFVGMLFALFVSASVSPPVALSLSVMLNSAALVFVLFRMRERHGGTLGAYVYALLALLAAIGAGGVSLLVARDLVGDSWWFWRQVADGIQFQGAPVLFLMGLSGRLLHKRETPAEWLRVVIGVMFLLTYVLAATTGSIGHGIIAPQRLAHGFRALFFAWFILVELESWSVAKQRWRYARSIYAIVWLIAVGMALPAFWIQFRIAFEHIVFVGGYVWLAALLAAEYSAEGERGDSRSMWEGHKTQRNWFVGLLALGLTTRVTSDIWTGSRPLHLAAASLCVIAALIIWGVRFWKTQD